MKKHKLLTLGILAGLATGVIYVCNKVIAASALIRDILDQPSGNHYYNWRFGRVYYRKIGSGKPILLVHDLLPGGSGYEWEEIEEKLSQEYTVYTLDLLGCGRSDKPKITYTNFIYVQLLCDFAKDIIGEQTDIVATGLSSSFTIMACKNNAEYFDKVMLVNPTSLVKLNEIPTNNTRTQKFLLEFPIIGTMVYHILVSKFHVEHLFMEEYMFNPFHMDRIMLDAYYEGAHMGDGSGKYLYGSLIGRYTNLNIVHGLEDVDNSIYIIGGKEEPGINDIIEDYTHYNPAIESLIIPKTKHFPHMEQPENFLEQVGVYFAS